MKGIYGANEKGDKNCINGISGELVGVEPNSHSALSLRAHRSISVHVTLG